jgi:hypothetical protein
MGDFGEGFEGLEALIGAASMIAQLARASYNANLAAGFTESQAMELAKTVIHEFFALMPQISQMPQPPQQSGS